MVRVRELLLSEHPVFMESIPRTENPTRMYYGLFFIYFFFLSSPVLPLRYFLSPELASVRLPRVCLCCHLCGSGIPTIHSHFADPFGVGRSEFLCGGTF